MKKLFTLLTLLLCAVSTTWADVTYYTPEADEVIILSNVYNAEATTAGYSTHTAIQWEGTAQFSSKTVGNPDGTPATISGNSCSAKGNGKGKNINVNISGVSKIFVYHESHASRYIQLKSGSDVIGSGSVSTYYTEVNLTGTTNYSILLHGTGSGSDDQDLYVYAIKLIKYGTSKQPSDLTITSGTTLLLEKNETSSITHTTSSSGAINYSSADDNVATVTSAGVITAKGGGKTKITVSQASDDTYAAGSKVVDVNVPYDNPAAADTYTLTSPELSFSNAAQTKHYFTNGFTITTDAKDGMQYAAIENNTGIKYSHVRTYTINTPSNVTATYLEIKARNNYPTGEATANWGTVLGTDYSAETLPYSDEDPQTKYFIIENPTAGASLSFSPSGNQWQGYITVHTNAWLAATSVSLNKTSTSIEAGQDETLTATLAPASATNQNVTWTSSDENVATVANGVVTAVAEGEATITATTEDGGFTATCTVTVTPIVEPIVTLPTGNKSGYSCNGSTTTVNRNTAPLYGQDVYEVSTSNGITITVPATTSVSRITVRGTSGENAGSTITITGANSESASLDLNDRDHAINKLDFIPTTQTTAYTITSAGKKSWIQIAIYGEELPTSVSATITKTGYATFSSPYALDFSNPIENLDGAYYASAVESGKVTMTKLVQTVPAETGLFLKGNANATVTIPVAASGTDINGKNHLKPNTSESTVTASTENAYHYVFAYTTSDGSNPGFFNLGNNVTLGAGKAYIETATSIKPTGGAKVSILFTDTELTGIVNAEANETTNAKAGKIYNIAGQVVNESYKGIKIIDGKKVF